MFLLCKGKCVAKLVWTISIIVFNVRDEAMYSLCVKRYECASGAHYSAQQAVYY